MKPAHLLLLLIVSLLPGNQPTTIAAFAPPAADPATAVPTLIATATLTPNAVPASPTPPTTPSATATEPQRSTPTPTACPNRFVDIGESNPLFRYVLALACSTLR